MSDVWQMTNRRKTHHGYYVTAKIDGGTANQRVSYLIGPFTGPRGHMAALAMVRAASRAANRTAFASFGTTKLTRPIDKPLPPGRLDLSLIDINDIIKGA